MMIATDLNLPTRELETFSKDSAITVTASITSHVQQQVGSVFLNLKHNYHFQKNWLY